MHHHRRPRRLDRIKNLHLPPQRGQHIVASHKIPALAPRKPRLNRLDQLHRPREMRHLTRRARQRHEPIRQKRIVIEHRLARRHPGRRGPQQRPSLAHMPPLQKLRNRHRRIAIPRLIKRNRRFGKRRHRKRVPRRHHLPVQRGGHPLRAIRNERRAMLLKQRRHLTLVAPHNRRHLTHRHPPRQYRLTRVFKVAPRRHPKQQRKRPRIALIAHRRKQIGLIENIITPLVTPAVGIKARKNLPLVTPHRQQQKVERVARHRRVKRLIKHRRRLDIQTRKLRVVVQHLLKVRHEPNRVHRVPMKAPTHVIAYPPARNVLERQPQRTLKPRVTRAPIHVQQKPPPQRSRKLHLAVEPSPLLIHPTQRLMRLAHHHLLRHRARRKLRQPLAQPRPKLLGLRLYRLAIIAPQHRDTAHELQKRRRRKIRPAVKRLQRRRQKHAHRPPTPTRHHLHRIHIRLVEVRTLLSINLHAHEVLIHQRRNLVVLKRLMLHHVTPVARRIPNRQKNRLVFVARPPQRRLAPRLPIKRIMRVLRQVQRTLANQPIPIAANLCRRSRRRARRRAAVHRGLTLVSCLWFARMLSRYRRAACSRHHRSCPQHRNLSHEPCIRFRTKSVPFPPRLPRPRYARKQPPLAHRHHPRALPLPHPPVHPRALRLQPAHLLPPRRRRHEQHPPRRRPHRPITRPAAALHRPRNPPLAPL